MRNNILKIKLSFIGLLFLGMFSLQAQTAGGYKTLDGLTTPTEAPPGTLPGNVEVSPAGAAGYNIPLDIQNAIGGLAPRLAITYNSNSGRGILGQKWSISGISQITIVPKNKYYDNKQEAVSFPSNSGSSFTLDGQRLISTSTNIFATENDNNSVITASGADNTYGYNSFTVSNPDGSVITYGGTGANAELTYGPANAKTAYIWPISSIKDARGNEVRFIYNNKVDGQVQLSKVQYNINNGVPSLPVLEVVFSYSNFNNKQKYYVGGAECINDLKLTSIIVPGNKVYSFTYSDDKITQIDLKLNNYPVCKPTIITWNSLDNYSSPINSNSSNLYGYAGKQSLFFGDFDSDGIRDIVKYDKNENTLKVTLHDGIGANDIKNVPLPDKGRTDPYFYIITDVNVKNILVEKNQGKDVLKVHYLLTRYFARKDDSSNWSGQGIGGVCQGTKYIYFEEAIQTYNFVNGVFGLGGKISIESRGTDRVTELNDPDILAEFCSGNVSPRPDYNVPSITLHSSNNSRGVFGPFGDYKVIAGDINNDGEDEELLFDEGDLLWHPYNLYLSDVKNIMIMDFDGDRLNEMLVFFADNKGTMLKYNGTGFSKIFSNLDIFDLQQKLVFGDFNGDGKIDFINLNNGSKAGLYLFDGLTYQISTLADNILNLRLSPNGSYNILSTIVYPNNNYYYNDNICGLKWHTDIITEVDVSNDIFHPIKLPVACIPASSPVGTFNPAHDLKSLDINRDGKSDLVFALDDKVTIYLSNGDGTFTEKGNFTIPSTLGSGRISSIELYCMDFDYDGQAEILYRNTDGHYYTTTNQYGSCGIHYNNGNTFLIDFPDELGKDLQVGKIKNGLDIESSIETYMYYKKSVTRDPSNPVNEIQGPFTIVKHVKSKYTTNNQLLSDVYYGYAVIRAHETKGYLGFTTFTEDDYITKRKSVTTFDYDRTYFVPFASSITSFINGVKTSTVTNIQICISKGTKRYFAYTSSITQKNELTGITNKTDIVFDNNCLLTSKKETFGSDGNILTEYKDFYKTKPKTIVTTRTQGSTYVTKQLYSYYPNGNIQTATDNNGNITTYDYYADNTNVKTTTYPKVDGAANAAVVTFNYDNTGRFVTQKKTVVGSIVATESYEYDIEGRPTKETDKNGLITIKQYDSYGALAVIINPNGRRVINTYGRATLASFPLVDSYRKSIDEMGNSALVYYDVLGRIIQNETTPAQGITATKKNTYNDMGQLTGEWSSVTGTVSYIYQNNGRIQSSTNVNGATTYSYSNAASQTTTKSTFNNVEKSKTINAFGQLVAASDAGGNIKYTYDPTGNLSSTTLNGNTVATLHYNTKGYQDWITEPNSGTTNFTYNNLGLVKTQSDAGGNTTTLTYDDFARVSKKVIANGTKSFTVDYGFSLDAKGLLLSETSTETGSVVSKAYVYDGLGRVTQTTETIQGTQYVYKYSYDVDGRITSITYPSGEVINQAYSGSYLTSIKDAGGTVIFNCAAGSYNKWGRLSQYSLGGNNVTKSYDGTYGYLNSATFGPANNRMTYTNTFENVMGNLMGRSVSYTGSAATGTSQSETFQYDKLDRLINWTTDGQQYTVDYSSNGNIIQKKNIGYYDYSQSKPNEVTQITQLSGPALPTVASTIDYNLINKVASMQLSDIVYTLNYGPDNQRKVSVNTSSSGIKKTVYAGLYEERSNGDLVHYISGPDGLCAYLVTNAGRTKHEYYYIYTDYLGSLTAVANSSGAIVKEFSFDPWGSYRNPANWNDYNATLDKLGVGGSQLITRGYTGQEYIKDFDLYNMNGRFYDSRLARFLSPDIVVHDPTNTQCYNRYSYCFNNPFGYTDPSGFDACDYKANVTISISSGGASFRIDYFDSEGVPVSNIDVLNCELDKGTPLTDINRILDGEDTDPRSALEKLKINYTAMNPYGVTCIYDSYREQHNFNDADYMRLIDYFGFTKTTSLGMTPTESIYCNTYDQTRCSNSVSASIEGGSNRTSAVNPNSASAALGSLKKTIHYVTKSSARRPGYVMLVGYNTSESSVKDDAFSGGPRPDADEYLTWNEAAEWARTGHGQPLYVKSALIDFSRVKMSDFDKDGYYEAKLAGRDIHNVNDATVHGSLILRLVDKEKCIAEVDMKRSDINFNFEWQKDDSFLRNIATIILEQCVSGNPFGYTPYPIIYQGPIYIND